MKIYFYFLFSLAYSSLIYIYWDIFYNKAPDNFIGISLCIFTFFSLFIGYKFFSLSKKMGLTVKKSRVFVSYFLGMSIIPLLEFYAPLFFAFFSKSTPHSNFRFTEGWAMGLEDIRFIIVTFISIIITILNSMFVALGLWLAQLRNKPKHQIN